MSKTELMALELSPAQNQWLSKNNINADIWGALQSSIYVGANPQSILLAIQYCRARGLDPLKKPVHIVPMEVKDARTGEKAWRDVIMVGINELLATASRTGEFVGKDAPVFGPLADHFGAMVPDWCEITVWRRVNGERVGFTAVEFFEECAATKKIYENKRPTGAVELNYMWGKRPRGQLAKTTLASALRVAFPVEIGSTYAAEEFDSGATAQSWEKNQAPNAAADLNAELGLGAPIVPQSETVVEPVEPSGDNRPEINANELPD